MIKWKCCRLVTPAIMVDENGSTKDKSRAATAVRKCILSSLVHIHTYAHKPLTNSPTSHYNDVTMSAISSQITSLTIVYSTVYSDVDQRKHQSSASLAFVRGIHRSPVNSSHKGPITRKMTSSCTILWIRLLSDRCHCSSAAMASVKYDHDIQVTMVSVTL